MKRILTSDDVLALVRRGETELVMGPEDRLTDLARELAQRRGVKLVDAAQASSGQSRTEIFEHLIRTNLG